MTPRPSVVLFAAAAAAACVRSREVPAQRASAVEALATIDPPAPSPAPAFFAPSPLLARADRVRAHSRVQFSDPRYAFDGDANTAWAAGRPTPNDPAWLAIDVGAGPTRLLFEWSVLTSFNYDETDYGSPGSYRLETSADSSDGADGTWSTVAVDPHVTTHGHVQSLPFAGRRWVRLVVTGAPEISPSGVQIGEVAVFDASAGASDTWFFMGDSITALAFGSSVKGADRFASIVHARHPRYFPAVLNGGIGGTRSSDGAARVEEWIAENPEAHFWAIGYGANDSAGNERDTAAFRASLDAVVERLLRAGRVPILATIPYATDGQHANVPEFNRVIDQLVQERGVLRGPDLYAWFFAHPDELRDGLHPNERGVVSMNRLWAEAVDALYPR